MRARKSHRNRLILLVISSAVSILLMQTLCCAEQECHISVHRSALRSTYSIVAYDEKSNQMGAAVQSHWFRVGPDVIWCEAGVGVVATQSLVEVAYGPDGLTLMGHGKSAKQALVERLSKDSNREVRQVAYLDAKGNVAAFTGKKCIPAAGHLTGVHYSVQANLMSRDTVWPAMAKAFEQSKGSLAERMLTALEAAQAEGGDIRGRQSAAIKVVKIKADGPAWKNVVLDLRVDDNPQPLKELRRLMSIDKGLNIFYRGEQAAEAKKIDEALRLFEQANKLLKNDEEILFWQAVDLFDAGAFDKGFAILKSLTHKKRWWTVLKRVREVGLVHIKKDKWSKLKALFTQME